MRTTYALLLDRCGLSHREAADLHDVRLDTVKSWSSGRNPTPDGVIAELRDLYARIERAAADQLKLIKKQRPAVIELGLAADDHEAQSRGWPCVGAQAAAYGIVAARATCAVRIAPAGSTPATALAADEIERDS